MLPTGPLPYHEAIREYLKTREPEIWRWYASNRVREEIAERVKFDLLKSTYRVEREERPELYTAAEETVARLSLDVPVTFYQAQNPQDLNASLAYVPGEAHVVLHGPVTTQLTPSEFSALLAHELSHLNLWRRWDGEYLIVDQILSALTLDRRAETSHFATARLFGLYTEIFCDRGALFVVGDPLPVISMLVKLSTGLADVNAENYLRQAEEVFSRETAKTAGLTHPETFIRARALKLWSDGVRDAEAKIRAMIEGAPSLCELDLLAQVKVSELTRRLLDVLLSPKWIQSRAILAHAKLFFDDYAAADARHADTALAGDIRTGDETMQDYYCYVLLDFVTSDPELEEYPLAAALALAEEFGWKERFMEVARRELRLRKSRLEAIDREKGNLLSGAGEMNASL